MSMEKNYKNEIHKLFEKINNSTNKEEQYLLLQELQTNIENFIETFNKDLEVNYTYKQKMYYYLNNLFNAYSCSLNFSAYISEEEKENIISKVKNYLLIYQESGTNFASSLIQIFQDNDIEVFGEFCLQILSFYSQRGTQFYIRKDKKNAKHFLEEGLSFIKKYSLKERLEFNDGIKNIFNSYYKNINGMLNILKAESIEKYCESFKKNILIEEDKFKTEEEKLDILDRFKEGLFYVNIPIEEEDKFLKAMYLTNIVKFEFIMFHSNEYDKLLEMINDCEKLKNESRNIINAQWYNELCEIKAQIKEKQKIEKENPKANENKIKLQIKEILEKIENKFNEGIIIFLFYILHEHEPNGLKKEYIFKNWKDLQDYYNSNKLRFLNDLKKLYHPIRYRGKKENDQKKYFIMKKISFKLNSIE